MTTSQEGGQTSERRPKGARGKRGFTLIELLIGVAIIGILAAIAIPNLLSAHKKAKYSRAASDSKVAVSQGLVHALDTNVYPGSIATLRILGYANIPDDDPWENLWVISDLFADDMPPLDAGRQVHVCSKGPTGADTDCKAADLSGTPPSTQDGGVGFSATYGAWVGS